jgi:glutathione S-transferase
MKLYMNPASSNARRVRLTATVLGIGLDEQPIDLSKGEQRTPEYLAINPNGTVPTLVDGDCVLTESRAIMQHLAAKKPESDLLPRDAWARTDVIRWQFWDAAHFSPQLGTFTFQKLIKQWLGLGGPDQGRLDEALTNFRRFAGVLNAHLNGRKYIVGNALTIADLTIASSMMYAQQTEVPVAEYSHIQTWFSHISEMDAWKKTSPH